MYEPFLKFHSTLFPILSDFPLLDDADSVLLGSGWDDAAWNMMPGSPMAPADQSDTATAVDDTVDWLSTYLQQPKTKPPPPLPAPATAAAASPPTPDRKMIRAAQLQSPQQNKAVSMNPKDLFGADEGIVITTSADAGPVDLPDTPPREPPSPAPVTHKSPRPRFPITAMTPAATAKALCPVSIPVPVPVSVSPTTAAADNTGAVGLPASVVTVTPVPPAAPVAAPDASAKVGPPLPTYDLPVGHEMPVTIGIDIAPPPSVPVPMPLSVTTPAPSTADLVLPLSANSRAAATALFGTAAVDQYATVQPLSGVHAAPAWYFGPKTTATAATVIGGSLYLEGHPDLPHYVYDPAVFTEAVRARMVASIVAPTGKKLRTIRTIEVMNPTVSVVGDFCVASVDGRGGKAPKDVALLAMCAGCGKKNVKGLFYGLFSNAALCHNCSTKARRTKKPAERKAAEKMKEAARLIGLRQRVAWFGLGIVGKDDPFAVITPGITDYFFCSGMRGTAVVEGVDLGNGSYRGASVVDGSRFLSGVSHKSSRGRLCCLSCTNRRTNGRAAAAAAAAASGQGKRVSQMKVGASRKKAKTAPPGVSIAVCFSSSAAAAPSGSVSV